MVKKHRFYVGGILYAVMYVLLLCSCCRNKTAGEPCEDAGEFLTEAPNNLEWWGELESEMELVEYELDVLQSQRDNMTEEEYFREYKRLNNEYECLIQKYNEEADRVVEAVEGEEVGGCSYTARRVTLYDSTENLKGNGLLKYNGDGKMFVEMSHADYDLVKSNRRIFKWMTRQSTKKGCRLYIK